MPLPKPVFFEDVVGMTKLKWLKTLKESQYITTNAIMPAKPTKDEEREVFLQSVATTDFIKSKE